MLEFSGSFRRDRIEKRASVSSVPGAHGAWVSSLLLSSFS
jgi:hypothetical protein